MSVLSHKFTPQAYKKYYLGGVILCDGKVAIIQHKKETGGKANVRANRRVWEV